MPSSGYRWDSLGAGPGIRPTATAWDLRWWIALAVLTSVAIHAALLVVAARIRMPAAAASDSADRRTGELQIQVERGSVPEKLLRDLAPEPPDLTREVESSPVTEVPELSQIAEAVQDRDVILTPAIESAAANLVLSTPPPGTTGDLLDDVAEIRSAPADFTESLLSAGSALQESMNPADDQVTIEIDDGSAGKADLQDDVVRALERGSGGGGGLDGFANLDDLVNYNGPIEGDFKTMLRTDLLFDFNSAALRDSARLSLLKLGYIIQNNEGATFRLIGHTDTIGGEATNQRLSEARAQAVRDWLVNSLRLDGANIVVEGRGEREPLPDVDPLGDADAQALNRRVEIHKTNQ